MMSFSKRYIKPTDYVTKKIRLMNLGMKKMLNGIPELY